MFSKDGKHNLKRNKRLSLRAFHGIQNNKKVKHLYFINPTEILPYKSSSANIELKADYTKTNDSASIEYGKGKQQNKDI